MGCDIHIHVEYKKNKFVGYDNAHEPKYEKQWMCGDYFRVNPYYDKNDEDEEEKPYDLVGFCDDRNYHRFAVLANVRNYGDTDYISEPRGLPEDVTEQVKADCEAWGRDGHSHSYFTLRELIDYQNNIKPLKMRGMISPEAQKAFDEKGVLPDEYCQWTNIPGWERREWEEENDVLVPLIEALKQRARELYVIHSWRWDRDPDGAMEDAKDIRIVFWFDN